MNDKIIAQGAEAIIIRNKNVIKKRLKKSYRFPELDKKIIKTRTKKESKILQKAHSIIPVPKVIQIAEEEIEIEYIKGKRLSEHLDKIKNPLEACKEIGKNIALLHNNSIIHGDLTTSNMILKDKKVYFIDFGLSSISDKTEHKSVDLHLIKEALKAKHFKNHTKFFEKIIESYKKQSNNGKEILNRLEIVEKRGRYKGQY